MIMATIGIYATPCFSGLYPHTSCRNRDRKKKMPNSEVPTHKLIRYAPDRFQLRSTRIGTSAFSLCTSIHPNATSSTAAAANDTITLVSPQCDTPFGVVAALTSP